MGSAAVDAVGLVGKNIWMGILFTDYMQYLYIINQFYCICRFGETDMEAGSFHSSFVFFIYSNYKIYIIRNAGGNDLFSDDYRVWNNI